MGMAARFQQAGCIRPTSVPPTLRLCTFFGLARTLPEHPSLSFTMAVQKPVGVHVLYTVYGPILEKLQFKYHGWSIVEYEDCTGISHLLGAVASVMKKRKRKEDSRTAAGAKRPLTPQPQTRMCIHVCVFACATAMLQATEHPCAPHQGTLRARCHGAKVTSSAIFRHCAPLPSFRSFCTADRVSATT